MEKRDQLPIILASASPRRRELLESAGWTVTACPANVDERLNEDEYPRNYVARLARAKAHAINAPADQIVLGADTAVVISHIFEPEVILGKPASASEAKEMLRQLAANEHLVMTGVCLLRGEREIVEVEVTKVWFSPLSDREIADYVATGECYDKAGAYAIQGRAARYIYRIEGSYSNVVGLPLATVWRAWQQLNPQSD